MPWRPRTRGLSCQGVTRPRIGSCSCHEPCRGEGRARSCRALSATPALCPLWRDCGEQQVPVESADRFDRYLLKSVGVKQQVPVKQTGIPRQEVPMYDNNELMHRFAKVARLADGRGPRGHHGPGHGPHGAPGHGPDGCCHRPDGFGADMPSGGPDHGCGQHGPHHGPHGGRGPRGGRGSR